MASSTVGAKVAPKQAQSRKFPLRPSEGWATVILAVVLVMITVSAIQSFKWTDNIGILTSTTLVGCALGFILAKQRVLPQSLADIPALALGILFALYQTANVDQGGNIGALISHLGAWVQVATSSRSSTDNAIFLLFLSVLTMLLGYVTMWLIFRSRSPWLAAIANAIVLLINLNYETDDKYIFAVLFMLVTLLLLVRFNLVEHMQTWRSKGLRFSSEIGWDFMQVGVIFAIAVMLLSVILPSISTNGTLAALWNAPNGPWSYVQNKFSQVFSVDGGSDNGRVAFGNSLAIQSSVNLPNSVVFTYTSTDTQNSFFEAVTFDHFTGIDWSLTQPQKSTTIASDDTTLFPESTVVTKVTQVMRMVNPPAGNYIFAGGEPGSFSIPVNAYSDSISLSSNDGGIGSYTNWQTKQAALTPGTPLAATSFVTAATATQLSNVPSPSDDPQHKLYPQKLLDRYTQLPGDLQGGDNRVAQTAKLWTANAPSMYDKMAALVAGFHDKDNGFQYSTTPGDPGSDSAVTLLQNKKGYCTWYATGFVMMARWLGFPARVAEGFAPGSVDPKSPGSKTVKGTDAHMWAQVYFPGYGWINFEPSASDQFTGFATLPAKPIVGNTGGSNDLPPPPRRGVTPSTTPTPGTTPSTKTTLAQTKPVNPVAQGVVISLSLLIALILLAGLGILAWWRLLFRGLSPISQTFARMALLGRFAGVKPQPAQTASEYGEALSSRIPGHKAAIDEITDLYIYERWSPAAPDTTPTLAERWRGLRDDLVRATVRRWPRRRSRDDMTRF